MTASEEPAALPVFEQSVVERVVRRALERPAAAVREWRVEPVRGGATQTELWRVSGTALDGDAGRQQAVPWSVVVKGKSHDDATSAGVPEVEAYRSGLLDRLRDHPFGLIAPRCFHVEPGPPPAPGEDATTWLWLEDVAEPPGTTWSLSRYGLAAYHLGRFNGALPKGAIAQAPQPAFEVPPYGWLGSGFLPYWLEMLEGEWDLGGTLLGTRPGDEAGWEHPLVRRHFPAPMRARLAGVWVERRALFAAMSRLPRTLAHGDAHRRNLLTRRTVDDGDGRDCKEQTVGVDWAVVGWAPLGEDPGHLTSSSLLVEADPSHARELDAAVFEEYLEGLSDAGWRVDRELRDQVRFGYAAHAPLNMGLFVGAGVPAAFARDWIRRWYERVLGRPLEESCERLATLTAFTLDLADDARALGQRLGLLG